jgi:hypothetical protein
MFVPFYSGCRRGAEDDLTDQQRERKRLEELDRLQASDIVSLPTDSQRSIVTIKSGHWVETAQRFKANREDMQVASVGRVERLEQPVTIPATNIVNEFTRRTVLPKGQEKTVQISMFVPRIQTRNQDDAFADATRAAVTLNTELLAVPLMTPIVGSAKRTAVVKLHDHEFLFSILSPRALSYQYLASQDAVQWIVSDDLFSADRVRSYELTLLEPKDNQYSLPSSLLTMTSVAVMLWDDVAPADLSLDQQNAIVDWIYWGGQLIISGPTSWARLKDSFLSAYLPAQTAENTELDSQSFAEMSSTWQTIDISDKNARRPIEIVGVPLSGLQLNLNDQSSWLPGSGQLVAERQLGRGRIVLTAFSLREPQVYRWPYFSSMLSTGLLRRWPREFKPVSASAGLQQRWVQPMATANLDSRMHSNLRILTRDIKAARFQSDGQTAQETTEANSQSNGNFGDLPLDSSVSVLEQPVTQAEGYEPLGWGGAAALSDQSGVTATAIESLRSASGIELPSWDTIIKLIGGYLLCLVPLNYLVFRVMGRLEFAWIAAPLMAIVGVFVVTKVAQLDIGFARRANEVAVLELYANHNRGHITQYAALYTSLSTNYSIEMPEKDSVALPLGDSRRQAKRIQAGQRTLQTHFGVSNGIVLEPLTVYSNTTEMLHGEQMINLSTPIGWLSDSEKSVLKNSSDLPLKSVLLLRQHPEGGYQSAWLGELAAGQQTNVVWNQHTMDDALQPWNDQLLTQAEKPTVKQLQATDGRWIGRLLDQIARGVPLTAGQAVMIGYTDKRLGAINIQPSQDQYDGICVLVAHLSPPAFSPIQPDVNILSQQRLRQDSETDRDQNLPGVNTPAQLP